MRHARQAGIVDALTLEHGGDVIAARRIHQAASLEFGHRGDAGAPGHQQDRSRMLKDHAEHDKVSAVRPVEQNAGRANPEIGFAGGCRLGGIHVRPALANFHVSKPASR